MFYDRNIFPNLDPDCHTPYGTTSQCQGNLERTSKEPTKPSPKPKQLFWHLDD